MAVDESPMTVAKLRDALTLMERDGIDTLDLSRHQVRALLHEVDCCFGPKRSGMPRPRGLLDRL